jgi:hypothetical protein
MVPKVSEVSSYVSAEEQHDKGTASEAGKMPRKLAVSICLKY